jgi:hypothetical protein
MRATRFVPAIAAIATFAVSACSPAGHASNNENETRFEPSFDTLKGASRRTRGRLLRGSECSGRGRWSSAPACLFGSSFYELYHGGSPGLEIAGEEQITSIEELYEPLWQKQLVLAVQQSSHSDVTTPEAALSRVDQQTVRRLWLFDREAARAFTVYEYGAGDNSYGAVFEHCTTTIVAKIHDGDFLECSVHPAQCLLGRSAPA